MISNQHDEPMRILVLASLLLFAGCAPEQSPTATDRTATEADTTIVAEPAAATDEREPAQQPATSRDAEPAPEPEPEPELLYARTDQELKQSFADAIFGLYRNDIDAEEAQRLSRDEMVAWLDALEVVSPRSANLARQEVGDVLERGAAVGLLLRGAHPAACARERDLLFIAVPESMQGETRPYDGLIVRDACDVPEGALCLTCMGAAGTRPDGTRCSCVCTTGSCPGTSCVSC